MQNPTRLVLKLATALALSAYSGCGDDHSHADDDGHGHDDAGDGHSHDSCGLQANCEGTTLEYMTGLEVASEGGDFSVTIESGGAPTVSATSWMIRLADADGNPIDDATLTVSTWSMDCHHDGPNPPEEVTADSSGEYTIAPVFAHGGPWETRIAIEAGSASDEVRIPLCIPGADHPGGTH